MDVSTANGERSSRASVSRKRREITVSGATTTLSWMKIAKRLFDTKAAYWSSLKDCFTPGW